MAKNQNFLQYYERGCRVFHFFIVGTLVLWVF